ncbi:VOC family protein [Saccharothrix longispora]|uniref:Catechol 2,3-dioxygenase-like lactoylglutathione lyase family enzyme n=1 Tax=Saccharothrix longispora TaxID=33920 RepID=A0ABU1Q2Y0_9PSEU|nr:VOC family protein [Saccharothrix longispora]MDR6597265.1 catechol 2,3-dioxygenase-like lactoylglutathione lyase family enzyme [Saccharothrix longispora]MDU0294704.1 VOC family protein [Saccharothrix longispora]
MIGVLQCVVLDCPEPGVLAEFYRRVLGGEVDRPDRRWSVDDDWSTLHTGGGVVLCFQRVGDHSPPDWPEPGQQFHLDVGVEDLDAAGAEVLDAGGRLLDGSNERWRVFADPAGHPFCLVRE